MYKLYTHVPIRKIYTYIHINIIFMIKNIFRENYLSFGLFRFPVRFTQLNILRVILLMPKFLE